MSSLTKTFYRRESVSAIWKKMDSLPPNKVAFFQGPPGTGKSSAVWRKCLDLAKKGSNVLWVPLDRDGLPLTVLYFQGALFHRIQLYTQADVELFIKVARQENSGIPLDTIIVDGASNESKRLEGFVRQCVSHQAEMRAYFTASTKVEQLRSHQNIVVEYIVVHGWTLEEYCAAAIDSDKPSRIYQACRQLWHKHTEDTADAEGMGNSSDDSDNDQALNIPLDSGKGRDRKMDDVSGNGSNAEKGQSEDNQMKDVSGNGGHDNIEKEDGAKDDDDAMIEPDLDDIRAILEYRYKYCGGSARWMFDYSLQKVAKLRTYCDSAENRTGILNGDIGPAATNYFIGSAGLFSICANVSCRFDHTKNRNRLDLDLLRRKCKTQNEKQSARSLAAMLIPTRLFALCRLQANIVESRRL